MLDRDLPHVRLKLDVLEKAMPATTAGVFGDMYIVNGAYTKHCLDLGCEYAALFDTLESPAWQQLRLENPNLDFFKGDFANPGFMGAIDERYDVTAAFDVLLHQAPLLSALHLMLEKTASRLCIVQPMLIEREIPNALVYLPGNTETDLYPLAQQSPEYRVFDPLAVNQANWIWGMTETFLESALAGEGFEVIYRERAEPLENPAWYWGGYIAERRADNPQHWSTMQPSRGLQTQSG